MTSETPASSAETPLWRRRGFRHLWAYSLATNLQDGAMAAAGPLIVATVDRSPAAVSTALAVQFAPGLLFGLLAGAVIDRFNRRAVILLGSLMGILCLGVLAVCAFAGLLSLPLIYLMLFLMSTSDVFVNSGTRTLPPLILPAHQLAQANANLTGTMMSAQRIFGPVIGVALFSAGLAVPYLGAALLIAVSVLFFSRIALPKHVPAERTHAHPLRQLHSDVAQGLRYTFSNAAVWMLVVLIFVMNISYGAFTAVQLFLATERTVWGPAGYGVIVTAMGLGAMLGMWGYGPYSRRFGYAAMLRIGLVFEVLMHFFAAFTAQAPGPTLTLSVLMFAWFTVFGAHEAVWGSISTTVRQLSVPKELMGRVMSVYLIGLIGGSVIGLILGGALGQWLGWQSVFWFSGALSLAGLIWVWGKLPAIAHTEGSEAEADAARG